MSEVKKKIKLRPMRGIEEPKPRSKVAMFTEALKKVLADPNTFTLTLKELLVYVNHGLDKENRITYGTFIKWCDLDGAQSVNTKKSLTEDEKIDFISLIEYSKVSQKVALTGKMLDDSNTNKWGTAWLLERKFSDLKLNPVLEIGSGGITLKIEGGRDTKQLMETIDVDFEDITGQKMLE